MGSLPAVRELSCPIAAKSVRAVLRRGGWFGGPPTMHVRCSETTCQYVNVNKPPCPLNVELFETPSDHAIAEHLAAQMEPTCLECAAHGLRVPHAAIRRSLWPLAERRDVRVRSGRCRQCGRRRMVVHGTRPRRAPSSPPGAPPGAPPRSDLDATTRRILHGIAEGRGDAYCPGCLALATRTSLEDVRQALAPSGLLHRFAVGAGECCSCGRNQPLLGAFK